MTLVPIFANEDAPYDGLYAVKYDNEGLDEFSRLIQSWTDTNFIVSYFMINEEYLKHEYFIFDTLDELVSKVQAEARELVVQFESHSNEGYIAGNRNLQMMFRPLQEKQFGTQELQQVKAVLKDAENYPKPILRLYGLRLDANTFIITGGAIKLVHLMQDHPDTNRELEKIELVKAWLEENDFTTQNDLIYCYGEE